MEKLICTCCGGKINRDTLTCEYCGTQYKKDVDNTYVRIETHKQPLREFAVEYRIIDEMFRELPPAKVSELAMKEIALSIAEIITPFCQYRVQHDIAYNTTRVQARLKVIEPSDVGLDFDRLRR